MSSHINRTARDQAILAIAQRLLGLKTLNARNSDHLDFREFAVWRIQSALEAAYDAGVQAAGGQVADDDA